MSPSLRCHHSAGVGLSPEWRGGRRRRRAFCTSSSAPAAVARRCRGSYGARRATSAPRRPAVPLRTQWMARPITPFRSTSLRSPRSIAEKRLRPCTMSAVSCAFQRAFHPARADRPAGGRCAACAQASPARRRRRAGVDRRGTAQPLGVALQRVHVAEHEADRVVQLVRHARPRGGRARPSSPSAAVAAGRLSAVRLAQLAVGALLNSPSGRPTK